MSCNIAMLFENGVAIINNMAILKYYQIEA